MKNTALRKISDKKYREKNRVKILAKKKEYRRKNPYIEARNKAHRRGIYWGLTEAEYIKITSRKCHYCWNPLPETGGRLDRIETEKNIGYMHGNVVPCCHRCNTTRMNNFTYYEMLHIIAPRIRQIDRMRRENAELLQFKIA